MTYSYLDPDDVPSDNRTVIKPEIVIEDQPSLDQDVTDDEVTLIYRSIINIYFSGNYNDAYERFIEFREMYPDHNRAYNAKYFIGECLYLKDQVTDAIKIFNEIIERKGSKTPDAYMMLGNSYYKLADYEKCRLYWNKLITEYPDNDLSALAAYKINNL